MSFTVAAITALSLYGGPGLPSAVTHEAQEATDTASLSVGESLDVGTLAEVEASDTASLAVTGSAAKSLVDYRWTDLSVSGAPGMRQEFEAAEERTQIDVTVSDAVLISATEGPVDSQEITSHDTARLRSTESAALFNFIPVTDTARLSVSETVSLLISGIAAKPVTDTASLSVAESSVLSVSLDVTDDADIEVSDESDVATTVEQKTASDDASLSVSEETTLNVFTGLVEVTASDIGHLGLIESASALEVRRIKHIAMKLYMPRMTFELIR